MTMKRNAICLTLTLIVSGCAAKPYTGETVTTRVEPSGLVVTNTASRSVLPGKVLAGSESESRQISAKVVSIDPITRQIVLKTTDGFTQTLVAGQEVRNFAQIKSGDSVNVDYFAAVTFEVRPPSPEEIERAQSSSAVFGRAPRESKPGVVVGVGDIGILVIDSIDKSAHTVTLSGPNGVFVFKSPHPENLDFVRKGDQVVVQVASLLAAKVTP